MDRVKSLGVVRAEARDELDRKANRFESLDSKAGIVLGFAGALLALTSRGGVGWAGLAARAMATVSGTFAVFTFWPQRFAEVDLRSLRDTCLGSEAVFTDVRLLDTSIILAQQIGDAVERKLIRLRVAMAALLAAAILAAAVRVR